MEAALQLAAMSATEAAAHRLIRQLQDTVTTLHCRHPGCDAAIHDWAGCNAVPCKCTRPASGDDAGLPQHYFCGYCFETFDTSQQAHEHVASECEPRLGANPMTDDRCDSEPAQRGRAEVRTARLRELLQAAQPSAEVLALVEQEVAADLGGMGVDWAAAVGAGGATAE